MSILRDIPKRLSDLPKVTQVVNQFSQFSDVWLFATPWTAACQDSLSISNSQSLLKLISIESVMPSNHFILFVLFSSCLQSFPASGSFPMSQFFPLGGQSIRATASASVLPVNIQEWFPLEWVVGSPCSSRDSQEFSPTPKFKSINSLVLSFLCGLTLSGSK